MCKLEVVLSSSSSSSSSSFSSSLKSLRACAIVFNLLVVASSLPSAYSTQQQCAKRTKSKHDRSNEYGVDKVGDFENFNESCDKWADEGECDLNAVFMRKECRKACREFYRKNDESVCVPIEQCQLYVAESSIPNAGLGLYTSVPLSPLSDISHPEIVINVIDINYHQQLHRDLHRQKDGKWSEPNSNGLVDKHRRCRDWAAHDQCTLNPDYMSVSCQRSCATKPDDNKDTPFWWLPQSYDWKPAHTHSMYEARDSGSLIPGLGMLANSHLALVNAILNEHPSIDTDGLQRDIDPGVGAYSAFHGLTYFTLDSVPAGMELLVDYGNNWFNDRPQFRHLPFPEDYIHTNQLLNGFFNFLQTKQQKQKQKQKQKHEQNAGNNAHDSFAQELLSFMRNDLVTHESTRTAIPPNLQGAKKAHEVGSAMHSVPNAVRSQEWLDHNGRCLDNIAPRSSTLPQAGRGAFATRPMSEGDVIAPAPMVHLRRSDLHMYMDVSADSAIEYSGEQLLLNYCYGHPDSSILLFPYSPITAFINTNINSSMINARIQWSTMTSHRNEWLDLSVEEVLSNRYAGLIMEFVATRDLVEGEEIFIDYGYSWKQAWESHLNTWTPMPDAEDHVRVEILNAEEDEIRTSEEQINDPYPVNVLMVCFVPMNLWDWTRSTPQKHQVDWYNTPRLLRFIKNSRKCSILERYTETRHGDDILYTATITSTGDDTIEVKGIPRRAIRFVDQPYTSDQHISNAFRHEIAIPDDIFPGTWRDQKTDFMENQENGGDYIIDNTAHWYMEDDTPLQDEECRFFLAESSIPGAGMSMYTGTDIEIGEYTQPEVAIHILDFREQARLRCEMDELECKKEHWWLPNNYEWKGTVTLGATDAIQATAMITGLGAMGNYHTGIYSAEIVIPQKNSAGLHRRQDPGAGAITTYDNARFQFIRPLKSGSEVFISYSESWLTNREDGKFTDIPLKNSYERANEFISVFERYSNKTGLDNQLMTDTLSFIREELVTDDRLRTAIPTTVKGLHEAAVTGSELHSIPDFVRPIAWLREHGRCLDYIQKGPSTVAGAGRGAFARLDMPSGHIIAPAPVLQINRALTEILWQSENGIEEVGDQLILNYCYGHRNSPVLLFPYSPVTNLINHSPGEGANAKLQWSKLPLHNSSWTTISAHQVLSKKYSGLILEFVATRDIQAGEEIFIDYGPSWQAAWDHHKENWKPIPGAHKYTSASEFNAMDDVLLDQYPRNVISLCFLPDNFVYNAVLRDGEFGDERVWYHDSKPYERNKMKTCNILQRYRGNVYTVEIKEEDTDTLIVAHIPRKSIIFIDKPYSTDQTMPGTFRHEIHLSDSLFPLSWID